MLRRTSASVGRFSVVGARGDGRAADPAAGAVVGQNAGDEVLRLHRDPIERAAHGPGLARLEAAQVDPLGVGAPSHHGQRVVVLLDVGLGVGQRRPHPDQQRPAIGPDAGHPAAHLDAVVVRREAVRELDADRAPRGGEAERLAAGGQRIGGGGEGPAVERDGVAAEDEGQAEQPAVRRQELGRAAAVGGGDRAVAVQPGLDQPPARCADAVGVERRGDAHDARARGRGGAVGRRSRLSRAAEAGRSLSPERRAPGATDPDGAAGAGALESAALSAAPGAGTRRALDENGGRDGDDHHEKDRPDGTTVHELRSLRSGDGVEPARMERMTPGEPTGGQPAAPEGAVPGDRFECVLGAGRMKPAARRQRRRDEALVAADQRGEETTGNAGRAATPVTRPPAPCAARRAGPRAARRTRRRRLRGAP